MDKEKEEGEPELTKGRKNADMLHGPLAKRLFLFALRLPQAAFCSSFLILRMWR